MRTSTKTQFKLGLISIAAALSLDAGAATIYSGNATVNITSLTATADLPDTYAWVADSYQSYLMTALNAGGLGGMVQTPFDAPDWNLGLNHTAQTSFANATGNTVQFTDGLTSLVTAGFNLSATSSASGIPAPGALPNSANGSALQSGTFTLVDSNGDAAAGSITFDIYYDLYVATLFGSPANNYSQATVNLHASDDGGGSADFSDNLLSYEQAGGVGSVTSGHLSWTANLGAGESAYYTLSGSAISVSAVPEPASYAMVSLGLLAAGAACRKRKLGAAAAA